ncbi:MAG: hypothetical protein H5T74_03865 [Actinobacteria bacterium]|nr:hypothetical protein [Actinomycetota bacterium]
MVQQPPGPPPGGMQPPPPPPGQPPQAPMGPPKVQLDTSKLPIPDLVVAGGALLCWIFALLGWYKASVEFFGSATGKGGYQWWPWTIYFLLFLFAGFMIANEMGNFMSLSLPTGLIYLGWGAAGTLFTLLGFLFKPSVGFGIGVKMGMNWPVWIIMILLSLVPIAGGFMKFKEAK